MELENLTSVFLYFLSIGVLSNLEAVKPFYRILIWIGMSVFSSFTLSLVMYSEANLFSWVFMSGFWGLMTVTLIVADIIECFIILRQLIASLVNHLLVAPIFSSWRQAKTIIKSIFLDPLFRVWNHLKSALKSLIKFVVVDTLDSVIQKLKNGVGRLFRTDPDDIDFVSITVIFSLAVILTVLYYNVTQPV